MIATLLVGCLGGKGQPVHDSVKAGDTGDSSTDSPVDSGLDDSGDSGGDDSGDSGDSDSGSDSDSADTDTADSVYVPACAATGWESDPITHSMSWGLLPAPGQSDSPLIAWGGTVTVEVYGCAWGGFTITCDQTAISGLVGTVDTDYVDETISHRATVTFTAGGNENYPDVDEHCTMLAGEAGYGMTFSPRLR